MARPDIPIGARASKAVHSGLQSYFCLPIFLVYRLLGEAVFPLKDLVRLGAQESTVPLRDRDGKVGEVSLPFYFIFIILFFRIRFIFMIIIIYCFYILQFSSLRYRAKAILLKLDQHVTAYHSISQYNYGM